MKDKKYLREELLKVVEDELNLENIVKRKEPDPYRRGDGIPYFCNVYDISIKKVRQAFIEAGLERELLRYKINSDNISCEEKRYCSVNEFVNFEHILENMSQMKFNLLKIINNNTEIEFEKENDVDKISKFVGEYLAGFIYNPAYWKYPEMDELGIQMIETLYAFYGLYLTKDEINKIVELAYKEKTNKREKELLALPSSVTREKIEYYYYAPEVINKYIAEDIVSKLSLNKKSEIQTDVINVEKEAENSKTFENNMVEKREENFDLTIKDKINLIKQKIEKLEEILKQEEELSTALKQVKIDRASLEEEIKNIQL